MSASGASASASKNKTPEKYTELTGDFYKNTEEVNPESTRHVASQVASQVATQSDSQSIYVRRHNTALLLVLLSVLSFRYLTLGKM